MRISTTTAPIAMATMMTKKITRGCYPFPTPAIDLSDQAGEHVDRDGNDHDAEQVRDQSVTERDAADPG